MVVVIVGMVLVMVSWTEHEIVNYGEILLYFSFKQCLKERPFSYLLKDFLKSKKRDIEYEE